MSICCCILFMFFRNTEDENMTNMNNTGTNNQSNNQVDIYDRENGLGSGITSTENNNINDNITIADENANNFYKRVKKGITLNGKLVDVPREYITRLTDKIGEAGYEMTDDVSKTVNSKYDEIEKTLADNNVSDINDLDSTTKDKIDTLINDIRNVL